MPLNFHYTLFIINYTLNYYGKGYYQDNRGRHQGAPL